MPVFPRLANLALAALIFGACTPIASVKQTSPRFALVGPAQSRGLMVAESQLKEGQKLEATDPPRALGDYLASANASYDEWNRHPSNKEARDLYNFAVARSIGVIESAQLDPWDHPLKVPSPNGQYDLITVRGSGTDRNPADYKIIPADSIVVGGSYFQKRITVDGLGAPVVAVGREEKTDFRKTLASRRLYGTATGIIRFNGHQAKLEFFEPLATEKVTVAGHTSPLAADFTAPLAVGLVSERPEKLGLIRLLRPEKYADTARLTRLQTYDASRTPVIFVHGLQDTPASWAPMINGLRDDPEVRRRYQFWVFSYPSGYPYPYSATLFRRELDSVARTFPDRKKIILVGHSMGGMISRLMITDVGDKIWLDYFRKSPRQTNIPSIPDETRKLLEESLIFNHRPEVKRVIFLSTPHRGSNLASNWIGRIGTSLVKMPFFLAAIPLQTLSIIPTTEPGMQRLRRMPNSIDTLAPNNRFVVTINKFPITSGIPYHSIIGDRGRGDTPNSSDGVVPYWSSHLDGARSELIVPSNHSSPLNPQAIAEVDRILRLHD